MQSELPDVKTFDPRVFEDERGFFFEAWNARKHAETTGYDGEFVQDNQSGSEKGVLRGLHYQVPPRPQGKLVRAVSGTVFDVAVDIRRSSPTFSAWVGVELSADNKKQLWVPPGFAHGFLAISDWAEIVYKVTDYYSSEHDRSIRWDDPDIGIVWPIDGEPILSNKDASAPYLAESEVFA